MGGQRLLCVMCVDFVCVCVYTVSFCLAFLCYVSTHFDRSVVRCIEKRVSNWATGKSIDRKNLKRQDEEEAYMPGK